MLLATYDAVTLHVRICGGPGGEILRGYPRTGATGSAVVGFLALGGTLASAVYDIVKAPQAARRENARRGLAEVALVPMVLASPAATGQGLALAGRF